MLATPYPATSRQMDLLRFIAGFIEANDGRSPSRREMRDGIGVAGHRNVQDMVNALEERGWIRRLRKRHNAIRVLHTPPIPRAPDRAPLRSIAAARAAEPVTASNGARAYLGPYPIRSHRSIAEIENTPVHVSEVGCG